MVVEYCKFGNILDHMRRHHNTFLNQLDPTTDTFLFTHPEQAPPHSHIAQDYADTRYVWMPA